MEIVAALGDPPPDAALDAAIHALAAGQLVGIPTDTVYGLGADPFRTGAADRLFAVKGRPRTVELPVLVADLDQALSLATAVPEAALVLAGRWWPGALTLVLPRRPDLAADLGSDDATIGIRCPDHPVPRALASRAGPLATTSANRHGEPPLTTAGAVAEAFGAGIAVVLDAGPCAGEPSTVVDCTGAEARCLREGRIPWADIEAELRG
ncbi:MAG: L-threonylcarbamoyladenylate synthase [Acidimicrobiales bacterium]